MEVPFPESLCHRCAAPPRYVQTASSTFILCPLLGEKYPRQPVGQCAMFTPQCAVEVSPAQPGRPARAQTV